MINEKDYEKLSYINIFRGIDKNRIKDLINCFSPQIIEKNKEEYIYMEGDTNIKLSIILDGSVAISKTDYWGREFLLAQLVELEIFGETFALLENQSIEVDVIATNKTRVLQIDLKHKENLKDTLLKERIKFKDNLLQVFAMKNHYLSRRLDNISQRKTRDKLLNFLLQQRNYWKQDSFRIPLNRQQLADYLCVERSALSLEMSKMKAEGLIDYNKNLFTLKEV